MVTLGTFRVLEIIDDGKIIYANDFVYNDSVLHGRCFFFFFFFFIELVESSVKEDEKR